MAYKPYYQLAGLPPQAQFLLKDKSAREFGVVEHYETDRARPSEYLLLEFFSTDPALAKRPVVWVDLAKWAVLKGSGRNLPDDLFEAGLDVYLQELPDGEKELRRERARKARFHEIIRLAEQGYSIAYQEMFPGELSREDFPLVEIEGRGYLVDDQYTIQPGDFRNQVSLVFVPSQEGKGDGGTSRPEEGQAALLCNWVFGDGYEILDSKWDEGLCHHAIKPLVENPELEKIYRERLARMRREGALLGVKPKPYAPPR